MRNLCFLVLAACLFACCDSAEKKASALLDEARTAVRSQKFDEARMLIDSLRAEYPRELDVRRSALAFSDTIEMEEAKVICEDLDRELTLHTRVLDSLKAGFLLEKNAQYQTVGYYVCPEQVSSKMHRTALRAEVNEEGQMLLISILHGTKLGHDHIRVTSSSGTFQETPRCFSFLTHSVQGYEEEASYKLGEDNGVVTFIAEDTGELTVTFISPEGKAVDAAVSASDAESVRKCYTLALAFAKVDSLRSERDKMAMKARFYERKRELGR